MKKLFYTLLAATALMACAKEADFNNTRDNEVINENGLVSYTFHAYFEDQTKASINESGKFSWGAAGTDQIAVWDATYSEFVTFTSTDSNGNFSCEAKPGASFNGQTAYYPASIATVSAGSPNYTFPTSFDNLSDAAKGFPMSGTVSADGKIPFAHLGCLIKMTLNNVPSFTRALILNDGSNDITVTATPTDGVINAVVPIPAGTYILTAKLKDDNNNIFYTKARGSKEYVARKYYPISPITLRHYLSFIGEGASSIQHVVVNKRYDNATTGDYGTFDLLQNASATYYFVLPEWEWTGEGAAVRVAIYKNDAEWSSTDEIYLYRDLTFEVPSSGGMKTSYRLYWDDSSKNYLNNATTGKIFAHIWGGDASTDPESTYPGNEITSNVVAANLYYYQWHAESYGKSVGIIINGGADPYKTGNITYTLNREYMYR